MKKFKVLLSIITLFVLFSCCGCSRTFKYYLQYTQDAGEGLYTIVYPNNYDIELVQLYDETHYSCVDIYSVMDKESRTRTHWTIEVTKDKYLNVSDAVVQLTLKYGTYSNVRKFEEQTITIDGHEARDVALMYTSERSDYETRLLKLQPAVYIYRLVVFEYNDQIWILSEEYSPESEPQDGIWFQNMLNSFKINQ